MGFDNRPANGKSYSRSGGFCRKERFEDAVLVILLYSRPRIFNGDQNTGRLLTVIGPYPQKACAVGNGAHRIYRVHNQIQKNLLQLTSIGKQLRESLAQFNKKQQLEITVVRTEIADETAASNKALAEAETSLRVAVAAMKLHHTREAAKRKAQAKLNNLTGAKEPFLNEMELHNQGSRRWATLLKTITNHPSQYGVIRYPGHLRSKTQKPSAGLMASCARTGIAMSPVSSSLSLKPTCAHNGRRKMALHKSCKPSCAKSKPCTQ